MKYTPCLESECRYEAEKLIAKLSKFELFPQAGKDQAGTVLQCILPDRHPYESVFMELYLRCLKHCPFNSILQEIKAFYRELISLSSAGSENESKCKSLD